MYLLPITTYSDYWRATRSWSSYLGGLAVFAAGTQYSMVLAPEMKQALQPPLKLTTQSLNKKELALEPGFLESRQRVLNQGSRGGVISQSTISRGVISSGIGGQDVLSQSLDRKEEGANPIAEDQESGANKEVGADQGVFRNQSVETSHDVTKSRESSAKLTSKIKIEDKEIPFETQYIESDKLLPGMSKIQEAGEKGILRQVLKTFEVDGKIVDQQVQSSFELKSPKKEIRLRNSKPVPKKKVIIQRPNSTSEESFELDKLNIIKTLTVESTAYTYTGSKTATGITPREGLIAVDPRVIAMGSKVYVEGYGYAIAADTGGDIRGNRIDVFFSSLRQCIDWGRRSVHIYVLNTN